MNETDAKTWIEDNFGAEALERTESFVDIVIAETTRQNLISPSTIPSIWARHVVDSAQLIALGKSWSTWLDIGTGGGFPGMVIALLSAQPVTMVEPRKLRAAFLQRCAADLGVADRCTIVAGKVEGVVSRHDVISARAVSGIGQLVRAAVQCSTVTTRWLLPRGSYDPNELEALRQHHNVMFHVEHSITAEGSVIVVLEGVKRQ